MAKGSRAKAALAVLWDLDGVLADTSSYHFAAWRRLMADLGRDLSEAQFRATFGQRNEEILERLVPAVSLQEIRELTELKERYFRQLLPKRIPPSPGVERLVKELSRAGVPQIVASSTSRENLATILPRLGLPLSAYVGAEDVTEGKPDPEVFLRAAERLGMPPEQCVVVEDSVAGVEAARGAGMRCVAVTTTWPPERLEAADRVVDSLESVSVEALRSLVGGDGRRIKP